MSESRSVTVRLTAETASYIRSMQTAGKLTADAMSQVEGSAGRATQGLKSLESGAGKTALAMVATLGASAKAAVDWESAFTGVTKTVDATATTSIPKLEEQLRGLAKTMPATHEEIAGVAEAAGQLGVGADNVTAFTETMVQLGETTNLSAEDAATSLARFANIMGTSLDDVDRLGSSVVGLGNNFETTEAEIVALSTRLAAAGAQAGLTEADVFGISAALSSVGVEAEAGGTAMSKVFTSIGDSVRSGGEDLSTFADVAGLTADEFVRLYESDPAAAIGGFVEGMGRIAAEGGNTTKIFKELGLTDSRLQRAVLSVGQATGSWADAVGLANDEYEKNTALTDEFGKRLNTTGAQVQVSFNNIKDAAINIGATLLPIVESAATGAADLASAFQQLPDPIRNAAVALAGITGAVGGGLWFTSKAIGSVTAMRAALVKVGLSAGKADRALRAVGKGFVFLGILEGFKLIDGALDDLLNRRVDGSTLQRDLDALVRGEVVGNVETLTDSLKDLEFSMGRIQDVTIDKVIPGDWGNMEKARADISTLDEALALLVESGQRANAAAIFQGMLDESEKAGVAVGTLTDRLDQYFLALDNAGPVDIGEGWEQPFTELYGATTKAAGGARDFGAGADDAASGASAAAASVEDWSKALDQFNAVLTGRASLRDYQAALDDFTATVRENGRSLDINGPKGREVQASLDNIASSALKASESLQGMDRVRFLDNARDQFIGAARGLGLTRRQAEALATELGLLDKVKATPKADLDKGAFDGKKGQVDADIRDLDRQRPTPTAGLNDNPFAAGYRSVTGRLADLNGRNAFPTVSLRDLASAKIAGINAQLASIDTNKTVYVDVVRRPSVSGFGPQLAEGGQVRGPGTTTSDSIPAMLSDREYVIRAAAVDHYGPAFFDAANAMRLAAGGMASHEPRQHFASGGRASSGGPNLNQLRAQLRETRHDFRDLGADIRWSRRQINDEVRARKQAAKAQKEIASSARGAMRHDPFGNGLEGFRIQALADRNDAWAMESAIGRARRKGISGGLLRGLVESGDLRTTQEVARSTRREVDNLDRLFAQQQRSTQRVARYGASEVGRAHTAEIRALRRDLAQESRLRKRTAKELGRLGKAVERGTAKGTRQGMTDRSRRTAQRTRTGR